MYVRCYTCDEGPCNWFIDSSRRLIWFSYLLFWFMTAFSRVVRCGSALSCRGMSRMNGRKKEVQRRNWINRIWNRLGGVLWPWYGLLVYRCDISILDTFGSLPLLILRGGDSCWEGSSWDYRYSTVFFSLSTSSSSSYSSIISFAKKNWINHMYFPPPSLKTIEDLTSPTNWECEWGINQFYLYFSSTWPFPMIFSPPHLHLICLVSAADKKRVDSELKAPLTSLGCLG